MAAADKAPIVVVSLGVTDLIRGSHGFKIQAMKRDPAGTEPTYPEGELADLVKGLRGLWRDIRAKGKRVIVVGLLPNGTFLERVGFGKIRRMNRMIDQQIKADNKRELEQGSGTPAVR